MADKELSEDELKRELLKARVASQQAQADASREQVNSSRASAAKSAKDEAIANKNAKLQAVSGGLKAAGRAGVGSVKAVGSIAKDGLMTGVAAAQMGKKAVAGLVNAHGSGVILAFLGVHFFKWLLFGPKGAGVDPYFGIRLGIDIFLFFYMWLIFFNGIKSLKNLGTGFAFAFGIFILEAIGLDGILGYVAPSLVTGGLTNKLFLPILWPWYFYVAVWTSDKEDLVVNLSKIGTILLVVFVVTQSFIPTLLQDTAQRFGLSRSENIAQAEDVAAAQPMGYWRASWACVNEGAFMDLDACRNDKMFPPKDKEGLASDVYKKEPLVVSLSEDVLFERDTITPKLESNFLLNIISPRKDVDVNLSCQVSGRLQKGLCDGVLIPQKDLKNIKFTVPPEKFSCSPSVACDVSEVGDYTFTIKANVQNIITESSLEALFIGKNVLEGYVLDYSDPKNRNPQIWRDLNGDGEIDASEMKQGDALLLSLEKGWFPGLDEKISAAYPSGVVSSKSDPDLSQLALSIGDTILNKANVGSQFELTVGLRNVITGSNIDDISVLEIFIPDGIEKADVGCDGFTPSVRDGLKLLTLDKPSLDKLKPRLGEIEKGFKAVKITSCILKVSDPSFLSNPNTVESKFFTGRVTYSQIVKKEFKVRKDTATAASDATNVFVDIAAISNYEESVDKYSKQYNVDKSLIKAIINQESGGKSNALRCENSYEAGGNGPWDKLVSKLGCGDSYDCGGTITYNNIGYHRVSCSYGLMQLMYPTAWNMGFNGNSLDLFNPDVNINYGTKYLAEMIKHFGGDVEKGVSAYNAGEGGVDTNPAYVASVKGGYYKIAGNTIPSSMEVIV